MLSHEEMLEAAPEAQRALMRAMQTTADPAWLHQDLTMGQLKALFALADAALTVGQVGELMGVSKPMASLLVDSLVRLNLLSRTEDAEDRRRTWVSLTTAGHDRVTQLRQGGEARWRSWLTRLSADDLAAVAQGFGALPAVAASESLHGHRLNTRPAGQEDTIPMTTAAPSAPLGTAGGPPPQAELQSLSVTLSHTRVLVILASVILGMLLASFQNPQLLLAPGVAATIEHSFSRFGVQGLQFFAQLMHTIRVSLASIEDSFSRFGVQGLQFFAQLMHTIRVSLASAVTGLFLVGGCAMVLALVAVFFLREIPLAKSHRPGGDVIPGATPAPDPSVETATPAR